MVVLIQRLLCISSSICASVWLYIVSILSRIRLLGYLAQSFAFRAIAPWSAAVYCQILFSEPQTILVQCICIRISFVPPPSTQHNQNWHPFLVDSDYGWQLWRLLPIATYNSSLSVSPLLPIFPPIWWYFGCCCVHWLMFSRPSPVADGKQIELVSSRPLYMVIWIGHLPLWLESTCLVRVRHLHEIPFLVPSPRLSL